MLPTTLRALLCSLPIALAALSVQAGSALCPAAGAPVQGSPIRGSAPLFPADNWWNLDIRQAPVDANSAAYIAFIGSTRSLHPDFGGEESPGSVGIYGMPYAVVDAAQAKSLVSFLYADESDGNGQVFYPIPTQAVTQPHWVEGGAPGNVDQRSSSDRHLLMVDCTNNHLYELYNVWYDAAAARWKAGSGAFFDMNTNGRRPAGWTSADAAGLAILPGLVRWDEVNNSTLAEIGHAFRVTVRATNGYVWPASHRAGSTAGALPMGARLRLKSSVNGADPALRTSDPNVQKIFRAMQKHGLIVADNGSDMYVSGSFDTRWNNDVLNPAFRMLTAADFEVVQLGWNPVGTAPALGGVSVTPASVEGGAGATGSVSLSAPAPAAGVVVALASNEAAVRIPASVAVPAGASSASFAITTTAVSATTVATLNASYAGVNKSTTLTVQPSTAPAPTLSGLALQPTRVVGGSTVTGTVTLSAAAPAGGSVVTLGSSNTGLATLPASVTVAAGARTAGFSIATTATRRNRNVSITAALGARTISAALTVTAR
jgi:hypothetical protein